MRQKMAIFKSRNSVCRGIFFYTKNFQGDISINRCCWFRDVVLNQWTLSSFRTVKYISWHNLQSFGREFKRRSLWKFIEHDCCCILFEHWKCCLILFKHWKCSRLRRKSWLSWFIGCARPFSIQFATLSTLQYKSATSHVTRTHNSRRVQGSGIPNPQVISSNYVEIECSYAMFGSWVQRRLYRQSSKSAITRGNIMKVWDIFR